MHDHGQLLPVSGDLLLLFAASFLGSSHCVAMCGPYVSMCGARLAPPGVSGRGAVRNRLLFNAGRIATYVCVGVFAGAFGEAAATLVAQSVARRAAGVVTLVAGMVTIVLGLAVAGVLRDPARAMAHTTFRRLARGVMQRAFDGPPALAGLLLGGLQGVFPCALVYAAASRAAAAGSAGGGATTMLVFGLGTLPAVYALTLVPAAVVQRIAVHRRWAGVLLAVVGILLVLRAAAGMVWIGHGALW